MTAEKLYGILQFLDSLDSKLGLQKNLEAIGTALTNLASAPAQPQHQSSLASALDSFGAAAAKMRESISPSQYAYIKAMGGEEFFDPAISDKVKSSVQMNAMTPAVARDFVQDLASRRATFLETLRTARRSLQGLNVRESELRPGTADMAFLIPRDIFDNQLGPFAKELRFINRLVSDFSEAITGTAKQPELEQLSSSIPTVALLVAVIVMDVIAQVVNRFLDAWHKIEKIRKIRADLAEMGLVKSAALDELTDQITATVDQVVEESTELVMMNYTGDGGRKNELRTAVSQDIRRLFGNIERGLKVEFRVRPDAQAQETDRKVLENLASLATSMKFPEALPAQPILDAGEVVEGDIVVKHSRKTTTHKTTTTTKKASAKDGGGEAKGP